MQAADQPQDHRTTFDVLLEAVEDAQQGKNVRRDGWDQLARNLPDDALSPEHQAKIDILFKKKQHGYRRTGSNIATRIQQILSARSHLAFLDSQSERLNQEHQTRLDARNELAELLVERLGKDLGRAIALLDQAGPYFRLDAVLKDARKQANAQKKAATAARAAARASAAAV